MANTQFVYRNLNTAEEVARDSRSSRFDALDQWVLVAIPDDLGKPQPIVEAAPDQTKIPGLIGSSKVAEMKPPAKNAPKDDWIAYAISRGGDADAVADMRRDDLIAEFGE